MATVDELLAGVSTVDKTLVISNDFRTINIPSSVPNLGVEYDDDVLRLDFKMPRYVSDTDLSEFSIRINYINAQGETDVYTVRDKAVNNQYITFSWLVGPTATRYKGTTKFNVCAKTTLADYTVDKEFNTTIASLPVLEGLEVDEAVVSDYTDVIEQWRQELFGIGDTEEASIRAAGQKELDAIDVAGQKELDAIDTEGERVLATIPPDYRTAVSMTDNADRTKADAIVCSAQGENIVATDSSDDYLRGLKVFGKTTQVITTGKNLVDLSGFEFESSVHTNVIPATNQSAINLYEFLKANTGKTIVLSMTKTGIIQGNPIGSIRYYNSDVNTCTIIPDEAYVIPELPDVYTNVYIYGSDSGASVSNLQIELGSAATEYEPYTGGLVSPRPDLPQIMTDVENLTVNVYNKNLWSVDHIELDGSSRGDVLFEGKVPLPVTLSWVQDFTRTTGSALFGYIVDGKTYFTASAEVPGSFRHVINKGEHLEKITLLNWAPETGNLTNIQLELGTTATIYETYEPVQSIGLNYTLSGIPVSQNGNYTDEDGQQWICDEIDFDRGVYVKRVGEITLTGTGTWQRYSKGSVVNAFRKKVNDLWSSVNSYTAHNYSLWSNYFSYGGYISEKLSTGIGLSEAQYIYLRFDGENDSITTVDELTAWLAENNASGNPVIVKYPLAEPIETKLTHEELEWFRFAHTNFPTTTVLNDAGATMELEYNADTRLWVDNIPKVTDEQAGPLVEAWMDEHFTDVEGVVYGKSAYEIAVERGFQGSEEYWLATLKGRDGKDGAPGEPGADGYVPVKGKDYFTDADKEELAEDVAENVVDTLTSGDVITIDDHVIEQGVTDIWTWRKWASGVAEIWGIIGDHVPKNEFVRLPFKMYDYTMNWPRPVVTCMPSGISHIFVPSDNLDNGFDYVLEENPETGESFITDTLWMPQLTVYEIVEGAIEYLHDYNEYRLDVHMLGRWKPLE